MQWLNFFGVGPDLLMADKLINLRLMEGRLFLFGGDFNPAVIELKEDLSGWIPRPDYEYEVSDFTARHVVIYNQSPQSFIYPGLILHLSYCSFCNND